MTNKLLSMLGICEKARKLASGNFQVESAVKEGRAYLVLLSEDNSARAKKSYSDMCAFYNTELYIYGTSDEISSAIGKEGRKAVCVTDEGLASKIRELLKHDIETMEAPDGKNENI